ncbi:YggT family protein [Starkeya koreensis]|uniref:YggT family protein n=1 Tax=Ancylobacter koreensis TaxID=266121 RepID=A0ABT0DGM8_9HYPH|nr:YggT family protein [Ancylobacter koreensis]MCK0206430.1 YggT family protein [Ancylobacter koreensis]
MYSFIWLFDTLITLYVWILIGSAILSWLVAFNVVNPHNQFVRSLGEFLWRVTEPVLAPIRRLLPNLGGIDVSPVILIILLYFIRNLVIELLVGA